jgi:predicted Zn-dependent peptidase
LEKTVARLFGKSQRGTDRAATRWPPEIFGGVSMKKKRLEQVHLCAGLKGVPAGHKDRYAAYVVNSVLGGSVSSRLFQEVREKRGLAYSIYSFLSGYSDAGTMTIYAGTRSAEVDRVLDLIRREVRRMAAGGVTPEELRRTKDQMKGSLMLSLESSHSRMNKLAKDELVAGAHTSLEEMLSEIDGVTEEQVDRVARELLTLDTMAITGLGPLTAKQLAMSR